MGATRGTRGRPEIDVGRPLRNHRSSRCEQGPRAPIVPLAFLNTFDAQVNNERLGLTFLHSVRSHSARVDALWRRM